MVPMLTQLEKSSLRRSEGLLYGTHQWSMSAVQQNRLRRIALSHPAGGLAKAKRKNQLNVFGNGALFVALCTLAVYLCTL